MSSHRFIILMNWSNSRENKTIIKRQMESKSYRKSWCGIKIIFEIALRDDCCIISFAYHIPFAISSIEISWFPLRSCSVWGCPTEWVWIDEAYIFIKLGIKISQLEHVFGVDLALFLEFFLHWKGISAVVLKHTTRSFIFCFIFNSFAISFSFELCSFGEDCSNWEYFQSMLSFPSIKRTLYCLWIYS